MGATIIARKPLEMARKAMKPARLLLRMRRRYHGMLRRSNGATVASVPNRSASQPAKGEQKKVGTIAATESSNGTELINWVGLMKKEKKRTIDHADLERRLSPDVSESEGEGGFHGGVDEA